MASPDRPGKVRYIKIQTIHPAADYNAQQRNRAIDIAAALNRGKFILVASPSQT
jgi:hypothetical protein